MTDTSGHRTGRVVCEQCVAYVVNNHTCNTRLCFARICASQSGQRRSDYERQVQNSVNCSSSLRYCCVRRSAEKYVLRVRVAHMPNLVLNDESVITGDDALLFLLMSQLVREGIESKVVINRRMHRQHCQITAHSD